MHNQSIFQPPPTRSWSDSKVTHSRGRCRWTPRTPRPKTPRASKRTRGSGFSTWWTHPSATPEWQKKGSFLWISCLVQLKMPRGMILTSRQKKFPPLSIYWALLVIWTIRGFCWIEKKSMSELCTPWFSSFLTRPWSRLKAGSLWTLNCTN